LGINQNPQIKEISLPRGAFARVRSENETELQFPGCLIDVFDSRNSRRPVISRSLTHQFDLFKLPPTDHTSQFMIGKNGLKSWQRLHFNQSNYQAIGTD
jgi:hypothetical protein